MGVMTGAFGQVVPQPGTTKFVPSEGRSSGKSLRGMKPEEKLERLEIESVFRRLKPVDAALSHIADALADLGTLAILEELHPVVYAQVLSYLRRIMSLDHCEKLGALNDGLDLLRMVTLAMNDDIEDMGFKAWHQKARYMEAVRKEAIASELAFPQP